MCNAQRSELNAHQKLLSPTHSLTRCIMRAVFDLFALFSPSSPLFIQDIKAKCTLPRRPMYHSMPFSICHHFRIVCFIVHSTLLIQWPTLSSLRTPQKAYLSSKIAGQGIPFHCRFLEWIWNTTLHRIERWSVLNYMDYSHNINIY